MECPFCLHDIAATWQAFVINTDDLGRSLSNLQPLVNTSVNRGNMQAGVWVKVQWLKCQNSECHEILVQIVRAEGRDVTSWIALPKCPKLPVLHELVTDPFRRDYLEAWTILADSPRMSAVLSRRLLADLLEKYALLKQFSLTQRIDEFIKDTRHPQWIRQNLHYLREVGDFGAHTQQDKTVLSTAQTPLDPVIINVDKDEAEWTLSVISDLFEYFIIAPQRDEEMRAAIDKKLSDAKRKPIVPLTS